MRTAGVQRPCACRLASASPAGACACSSACSSRLSHHAPAAAEPVSMLPRLLHLRAPLQGRAGAGAGQQWHPSRVNGSSSPGSSPTTAPPAPPAAAGPHCIVAHSRGRHRTTGGAKGATARWYGTQHLQRCAPAACCTTTALLWRSPAPRQLAPGASPGRPAGPLVAQWATCEHGLLALARAGEGWRWAAVAADLCCAPGASGGQRACVCLRV